MLLRLTFFFLMLIINRKLFSVILIGTFLCPGSSCRLWTPEQTGASAVMLGRRTSPVLEPYISGVRIWEGKRKGAASATVNADDPFLVFYAEGRGCWQEERAIETQKGFFGSRQEENVFKNHIFLNRFNNSYFYLIENTLDHSFFITDGTVSQALISKKKCLYLKKKSKTTC